MTGQKRRRKHRSSPGSWKSGALALRQRLRHPLRALLAGLLGSFLCWAVLTGSLPYVLAAAEPELALTLNPNNPAALVSKAERLRAKLMARMESESGRPAGQGGSVAGAGAPSLPMPQEAAGQAGLGRVREDPRGEIRKLAARAIASDPLNAEAFQLLGEMAGDPAQARLWMREAVKRSRRETPAVLWLLNDSFHNKDFPAAIGYADILLRTRQDMASYAHNYLLNISRDAGGRGLVADRLAAEPGWRRQFLASLWELAHADPAALALVAELGKTGKPADTGELGLYIGGLAWHGASDVAYNLWLRTLPPERLENLGFLTSPGFEAEPPGAKTVFDWVNGPGVNALAEFVPQGRPGGRRLLHLSFSEGRIELPVVFQVLVLAPGRYRLTGEFRGPLEGKRGLRWRLSCNSGAQADLGETEMLLGQPEQWRVFTLEASVPSGDCVGQVLRLVHDARSASEEYLSGEAWFADFRLERMGSGKSAAR